MNLALSEEQTMIREAAADVLTERSASAAVRHALEHSGGRDEALWRTLAGELGWCALAVPEAAGGAGLGAMELVLLMEQMGRRLACVPYFSTACLAATALAQCDSAQADVWLERIASGEVSATLALPMTAPLGVSELRVHAEGTAQGYRLYGTVEQVFDGAATDLLLVPARIANEAQAVALFEIDPDACGLTRTPLVMLDATRPLARVELQSVEVPRTAVLAEGRSAEWALSRTAWFAALALAAEQLGGAQQCLDLTVAYTSERVQFGRAIASFQAVKHRCAQMMVEVEATRSAVLGAAKVWDAAGITHGTRGTLAAEVLADIATAKATANDAFRFCAQEAIQLHGGVGFTWEYDPQFYFKRAYASSAQFGTTQQLLAYVAQQLIDQRESFASTTAFVDAVVSRHASPSAQVLAGVTP
ncbi:alkylation response protein AidB-like acyl-CoA dehydrogenase [Paraburkholderia sp. EB58]|jgi:alkylation response protein AidB-like acyl-CoA dehydrogenase|uniref:acyl-CoA dehydrogenase family protein n=1 Tax=Paraburkholderia sp. EB58 TaxID=3035125 RepID=UPI003D20DA50